MPKKIGGGLASWSVHHPVGVVMIMLAVMVLGLFALGRLGIDLLPHIVYPEIRARVINSGVPAKIMEDQVTRQLEEQLAITEHATYIQSNTREGRSAVDLSFAYGTNIDEALRDASTRLDRAKRFLPKGIDPPIIYKRDPSQRAAAEFIISSALRNPVELRTWVDYTLRKWLINIPGVAAAEVGGGLIQEIQIAANQNKLIGLGLDMLDLAKLLEEANVETPSGRLLMSESEISGRISGRFQNIEELINLPLPLNNENNALRLGEITQIIDGTEDERMRIRLNGVPGVKLSIQKQPGANTVAVVDEVIHRINQLQSDGLVPSDIDIHAVDDQARYIRKSLNNAVYTAASGALLAMFVVFIFLGSLRRTLIIGSAIPIAILVTFILMGLGGLTLNMMTLGGLALGIGMLVDSTIVMLENIHRHQNLYPSKPALEVSHEAAAEVNSAIVASTTTNLAAVLPFLFIGGLVGLLFSELIITISAAIFASLIVALTLVPALAGRLPQQKKGAVRRTIDTGMEAIQSSYANIIKTMLHAPWLIPLLFIAGLAASWTYIEDREQIFLPSLDEGRVTIRITTEQGINLDKMDEITEKIESMVLSQADVDTVFTSVGGFVSGRYRYEAPNRAALYVRLKPMAERRISSDRWIKRMRKQVTSKKLVGLRVHMYTPRLRGIRINRGDDDISLRIIGAEIQQLEAIAIDVEERLKATKGLRNIWNTATVKKREISITVDRQRAGRFGLSVTDVGKSLKLALKGIKVTDFIRDDRSIQVRLRIDQQDLSTPQDIESVVIYSKTDPKVAIRLGDIASINLIPSPSNIFRVQQQRAVIVKATLTGEVPLGSLLQQLENTLDQLDLPKGYAIFEAGSKKTLQESRDLNQRLLALALFLVFVVMAVQYESLRNPLVIILSVPFAVTGVAIGLEVSDLPLSMPVWLGLIMLAGIVVNNAIVLVEYIEVERRRKRPINQAIIEAARLRFRPILMTTLTTVAGMLPLALAIGEGAEMLQPLAVTIVSGLIFSFFVSLLLVPATYRLLAKA